MESPKKIGGSQYPFLARQLQIPGDEYQLMQNSSSSSCSSSSSPPVFQGNVGMFSTNAFNGVWNDIEQVNVNAVRSKPDVMSVDGDKTLEEFLIRSYTAGNHESFVNDPLSLSANRNDDQMVISQSLKGKVLMPMPVQFQVSHDYLESERVNLDRRIPVDQSEELKEKCERKQRRKIKNRESAARSRARKQAHTNELQQRLLELKTTNNWLKKRKEGDVLLNSTSTCETIYQLRRTSSTGPKILSCNFNYEETILQCELS